MPFEDPLLVARTKMAPKLRNIRPMPKIPQDVKYSTRFWHDLDATGKRLPAKRVTFGGVDLSVASHEIVKDGEL